ncbi:putative protein RfaE, domain II, partial [Ancylostoma ceylanicum]
GKDDKRPINSEDARAVVLAGLSTVDLVVIFDEDTPLELIRTLQPDRVVKGSDYDAEERDSSAKTYIVGADIMDEKGGQVVAIPLVEGFSTTGIIGKIRNSFFVSDPPYVLTSSYSIPGFTFRLEIIFRSPTCLIPKHPENNRLPAPIELKGISQEALATQLGISQQAYQKIESGATRLDIERANVIAHELGLMSPNRFNIRVYGILINEHNEVLISDEHRWGMSFTKFPGGGLEWGEGLKDCLIREFREELSINIEIGELFYCTDFFVESAFKKTDQLISIYYK